jgi:hypothetical protein
MTGKAQKPTRRALQRWETEGGATEDGPQTSKRSRLRDASQLAKFGKAWAASMTPTRRAQIAKAAAKARWNKR